MEELEKRVKTLRQTMEGYPLGHPLRIELGAILSYIEAEQFVIAAGRAQELAKTEPVIKKLDLNALVGALQSRSLEMFAAVARMQTQ